LVQSCLLTDPVNVVRNLGVKTGNVGGSRTAGDALDQPVENSIMEKGTALVKLRERGK
jgi:hypothetical protein